MSTARSHSYFIADSYINILSHKSGTQELSDKQQNCATWCYQTSTNQQHTVTVFNQYLVVSCWIDNINNCSKWAINDGGDKKKTSSSIMQAFSIMDKTNLVFTQPKHVQRCATQITDTFSRLHISNTNSTTNHGK